MVGLTIAILLLSFFLSLYFWGGEGVDAFKVGPARTQGKVPPQLECTWDRAVLLAPDGSLWAWGGNHHNLTYLVGQPGPLTLPLRIGTERDWVRIAVNHTSALALKDNGTLWGWGNNRNGQLGIPSAEELKTPLQLGSRTNWADISVGAAHGLGLTQDGTLFAWGQNDRGQVGDGTTGNRHAQVQIGMDGEWAAISAGHFNSYALKKDGSLWRWGLDLAAARKNDDLSPTQIGSEATWKAIAAGDYHLAALRADGTLWVCGQNVLMFVGPTPGMSKSGPMTQLSLASNWVEVHSGQNALLARDREGTWWGSGRHEKGQLGLGLRAWDFAPYKALNPLPITFEPWALDMGDNSTVLLTKDGTLWSWGTRLGSWRASVPFQTAKQFLNQLMWLVGAGRFQFSSQEGVADFSPHKVWELPRESKE